MLDAATLARLQTIANSQGNPAVKDAVNTIIGLGITVTGYELHIF